MQVQTVSLTGYTERLAKNVSKQRRHCKQASLSKQFSAINVFYRAVQCTSTHSKLPYELALFVLKNAFYSLNYYNIHHQFGIDGSFFYITLVGIRSDQILKDQ